MGVGEGSHGRVIDVVGNGGHEAATVGFAEEDAVQFEAGGGGEGLAHLNIIFPLFLLVRINLQFLYHFHHRMLVKIKS